MTVASRATLIAVGAMLHATAGCAQGRAGTQPAPAALNPAPADTSGLIPPGFGTLRQDDIAIKLQLTDVLVKVIPLDENVIRTLSADSYSTLHRMAESQRAAVARLAGQHGLQRGALWYVTFYGLAPDARFSPLEITVTVKGQDFRPLEVLPLSSGFGEQRLQPRVTQSGLYLFDDALDVNQALVVTLGSERNAAWATTLSTIERERALIRSRALSLGTPPPR